MSIKYCCIKCGQYKDESEYPVVKTTGERSRYCVECTNGSWRKEETKVCGDTLGRGCGKTLPLSSYKSNGKKADGTQKYKRLCKTCYSELRRKTPTFKKPKNDHEQWCSYHKRMEPVEEFAPSQRNQGGKFCREGHKEYNRSYYNPPTKKQTVATEPTEPKHEPIVCSYCGKPQGVVEIKNKTQPDGKPTKTPRCMNCSGLYNVWYKKQPKNKNGQLLSRDRKKNTESFRAFITEYNNPKKPTLFQRVVRFFRGDRT